LIRGWSDGNKMNKDYEEARTICVRCKWHTIIDFFSWHTASLKVDRSIPITFCILGHLESSMYIERPKEE
jgi:hypothetical protein